MSTAPDLFSEMMLKKFDMEIFEFFYMIRDYCLTYEISKSDFFQLEGKDNQEKKKIFRRKVNRVVDKS